MVMRFVAPALGGVRRRGRTSGHGAGVTLGAGMISGVLGWLSCAEATNGAAQIAVQTKPAHIYVLKYALNARFRLLAKRFLIPLIKMPDLFL
ncbi:MAG: hypothetical protein ACJAR9_001892 [Celeribacter sp.]|jgi:hypothetical protein